MFISFVWLLSHLSNLLYHWHFAERQLSDIEFFHWYDSFSSFLFFWYHQLIFTFARLIKALAFSASNVFILLLQRVIVLNAWKRAHIVMGLANWLLLTLLTLWLTLILLCKKDETKYNDYNEDRDRDLIKPLKYFFEHNKIYARLLQFLIVWMFLWLLIQVWPDLKYNCVVWLAYNEWANSKNQSNVNSNSICKRLNLQIIDIVEYHYAKI